MTRARESHDKNRDSGVVDFRDFVPAEGFWGSRVVMVVDLVSAFTAWGDGFLGFSEHYCRRDSHVSSRVP